jgi:DNA-directed RNA polymerase II subunit RPB1
LQEYDVDLATLDLVCNEIVRKFVDSHMSAGAAIGVISSQSLAQPLTQMILNSIHSAKAGGGVDRYREISNMKPTSAMKAPTMHVELNEEYEHDRAKVLAFAKNLEHIFFADIILGVEMWHEAPLKPSRKEDASIISEYIKYSGSKAPEDLANYSIRLKIDKYKLVEKYVDMETVMKAVYRAHPGVWIAYRDDNSSEVVVYVYCRVGSLPKGNAMEKIQKLYDLLRNTLIRGVDGIIRADVKEGTRAGKDGQKEKYYYIETLGTNLRAMLTRPEVRKKTLMSNSIVETYEIYGVLAAKNKIITEMAAQVPGVSIKHIMTVASLVVFRGELDPLNRFGNIKGGGSVLMSLVDGAPQQILRSAGTHGHSDKVNTIAGSLLLSQPPEIGSFYSTLVVNERFVRENTPQVEETIEMI